MTPDPDRSPRSSEALSDSVKDSPVNGTLAPVFRPMSDS